MGLWRSRALVGYRNWAYDTVCTTNKIISHLSAWCIKWRDIKLSFLSRSSGTLSTMPCDISWLTDWLTGAVIEWQALTLPYMPSSTPSSPGIISRVVDIPPDECLRRWASRQGSLTQRQIDRCLFSLVKSKIKNSDAQTYLSADPLWPKIVFEVYPEILS